jgi:hypothetical protein
MPREIRITVKPAYSDQQIIDNLNYSLKLNYPVITPNMKSGVVSICGGGRSIKDTLPELKGDVWACNGTYNWMLEQGVTPDYAFFWDSGLELPKYIEKTNPKTTFLVASICHPEVFKKLEGCNVLMWHPAWGKVTNDSLLEHNRNEIMIGGGSACITRAPFLASAMGYKEIHLHGADSSAEDGETHIAKGSEVRDLTDILCAGRWFKTPKWLAAQADEFTWMTKQLKGSEIIVHGDGLLPHIARVTGHHYHNV